MSPIARFSLVALDCPDPAALADFYGAITGWSVGWSSDDWVQLASDRGATLAFQRVPDHQPPSWPDGLPQQAHLDFDVPDLEAGERQVIALGAVKADVQPKPESWRVYLDPAGHPFCLVVDDDTTS
jgi:catechol 2,3-dioxygenase-like lactoylglutathione lyase family enzyme